RARQYAGHLPQVLCAPARDGALCNRTPRRPEAPAACAGVESQRAAHPRRDRRRLAFEEFPDFVEPALGARVVARRVLLADGLEFLQQLALARGEVDRRLDHDVAEKVARRLAAHPLDALATQAEGFPALGLGGNLDARAAVERRDVDVAAE